MRSSDEELRGRIIERFTVNKKWNYVYHTVIDGYGIIMIDSDR